MNGHERTPTTASEGYEEDRLELRHYWTALQRNRYLIGAIVLAITTIVLIVSLALPKTYTAEATVVLQEVGGGNEPTDAESVRRRLATIQTVLGGAEVAKRAAKDVSGTTASEIEGMVESSVSDEANVITVSASDEDARKAAAVSNAVADALLEVQRRLEGQRLAAARARLREQIDRLALRPTPDAEQQVQALRERLADLLVQGELAGFELQVAEPADVPSDPSSPRPLRNTLLAFFASLFLGVLAALLRDRFNPGISDAREISRLTGLPVLTGVPYAGSRLKRKRGAITAMEHGAYQTLAATLQMLRPPDQQHTILVTSAVHAEGKSTVTARLGRALAEAGHRTLLISVDMRWPTLHDSFRLPQTPGLSDALVLAERAGISEHLLPASVHPVPLPGAGAGARATLDVLSAGGPQDDPGRLLSSESALAFFEDVKNFDYRYILLDAPPLLGIADAQAAGRAANAALLVARLDRLTLENVADVNAVLGRMDLDVLGWVVIGARVEGSPYYIRGGDRARSGDRTPPVVADAGAGLPAGDPRF